MEKVLMTSGLTSFNSNMVRLKVDAALNNKKVEESFNSNMVRLKDSHGGKYGQPNFVSIPIWSD